MSEVIPGGWMTPPPTPPLREDEIHVWVITAPQADDEVQDALSHLLSGEESARASRFRYAHDRRLFTAAHGALRLVLASTLKLPPGEIPFTRDSRGKPQLAASPGGHDLRFNLTHSGEIIGIATTLGREVGIDIEKIRADLDIAGLARRFLTTQQAAELEQLSPEDLPLAFFTLWTRREALLKASGQGLAGDSESNISSDSGHRALPSSRREGPERWHCITFDPGNGSAAAIAAEGEGWRLVFLRPDSLAALLL